METKENQRQFDQFVERYENGEKERDNVVNFINKKLKAADDEIKAGQRALAQTDGRANCL